MRDTQLEPTKSGVIGLLGCALGYPVGDHRLETELDAGLRYGVRVESPGRVIEDYQTITGFLPTAEGSFKFRGGTASSLHRLRSDPDAAPATIISQRYYLEDASFLAALEEKEGHSGLLTCYADALMRPKWPIFLGRKSCVPTRPVFEALTEEYAGLEDAIRRYPWSWLEACGRERTRKRPRYLTAFVEDDNGHLRQDAVRINPSRQYGFRYARPISVELVEEVVAGVPIED